MDEVLADPSFVAFKSRVEEDIKALNEDAAKAEEFISRIEGILRG